MTPDTNPNPETVHLVSHATHYENPGSTYRLNFPAQNLTPKPKNPWAITSIVLTSLYAGCALANRGVINMTPPDVAIEQGLLIMSLLSLGIASIRK